MRTLLIILLTLFASAIASIEENRGIEEEEDLFEGDIMLTEEQKNALESRAALHTRKWPGGEVVYELNSDISSESKAMTAINGAFAEYAAKTCIKFRPKTSSDRAYISIFKGGGCYSYVGMTGSKQQLSLAPGCWHKGIVIHELAHALGFYHEQSRPDRDQHVTIKFENIQTGKEGNFRKHSTSQVTTHNTPYDYNSVMHYGGRAFTKNGQPTIVSKKPGVTLGQRRGLSAIDQKQVNMHYSCQQTTPPPTTPSPTTQGPLPGAFKCNFDKDMCGFINLKSDKFDWTRRSGSTPSSGTGPQGDHTTGHGHYMYIETSSPRKPNDNAKLEKPGLSFKGNTCVRFYYHMLGANVNRLIVRIGSKVVFTVIGRQGDQWKMAEIRVTDRGYFPLVFEGVRGNNWQGDIAIDDVTLGPCGAPPTTPTPTTRPPPPTTTRPTTRPPTTTAPPSQAYTCHFEKDLCGFQNAKNDKFDWTRQSGGTPSSGTGPPAGNGGRGYYMYIETSNPRRPNDNAKLELKGVTFGGNTCISFYYHMYGANVGALIVRAGNTVCWQKKGSQGNQWQKAEVRVQGYRGVNSLVFEGVRGSSWQGDIAIDDVRIECCGGVPPTPTRPSPTPPKPSSPAPPVGRCGVRPLTRIVGGVNAKHGDWPWQAQLRTSSGFPFCGGSVVAPNWIVTATHCVSRSDIVIRVGAHRRINTVGTEQDVKVVKIIKHPSYHSPTRYAHDIALLKLESPLKFNKYVHPVCLPDHDPAPTDGKKCWITGWGRLSSGGATPDYLQQVSVPIASRARCDKAYPGKIHDSMICAGLDQGGIDSCQGDSGGPMVCETGGRFYLHGATSWGYGCASPGKFGVYARVKYVMKWLKSEMAKN